MKKKLLVLFVILFVFSALMVACSNNTDNNGNNNNNNNEEDPNGENKEIFTYVPLNGEIKIMGLTDYGKTLETIVIPEKIDDLVVTRIFENAFYANITMKSITIPSGVTYIENRAFMYTYMLETINFNATKMSSLSSNGNYIFYSSGQSGKGITVNIGENVQEIPDNLFRAYEYNTTINSPKIVAVNFAPNSVCTVIGSYAFGFVKSLEQISLPAKIKTLEFSAFSGCNLKSITLPSELKTLETGVFANNYLLEEINFNASELYALSSTTCPFAEAGRDLEDGTTLNIGANVTLIPDYLFNATYYESYITKVVFAPNSVCKKIGYRSFEDSYIRSINIPNSVSSIESYAFSKCENLGQITIPSSVTLIRQYAFSNCTNLTSVTFESPSGWFSTSSSSETSGTTLVLTDASANATLLVKTTYHLKKSE